jgi:hypothetical protein
MSLQSEVHALWIKTRKMRAILDNPVHGPNAMDAAEARQLSLDIRELLATRIADAPDEEKAGPRTSLSARMAPPP